jgi:chorismate mutase/prephenate dehydratase
VHALLEDGAAQPLDPDASWRDALRASNGPLPQEGAEFIFHAIRAVAHRLEQPARVAYVGVEGGFGHAVARGYFGPGDSFIECATAGDALEEVERQRAAFAVLPWDSSVEGLAKSSIVALARTELVLCAGRESPATFHAMSLGVELSAVKKVYATASARAACDRFLHRELSKAAVIDVRSPYIAAQLAREDATGVAIVPEACGRSVGLEAASLNVGDEPDMRVRYGIVGARPAPRTEHERTCLLFTVEDKPGALFSMLRHFAERQLNLKKLQTMRSNAKGTENLFYVEVEGHATDRAVVTALEEIKSSAEYLRVLGSLPSE